MFQIEGPMRNVENTTINNTPVIQYLIPNWNKQIKKTEWYKVTAWNPAESDRYADGRKISVTLKAKPRNKGGFFYTQTKIEFLDTAKEAQMALPGF